MRRGGSRAGSHHPACYAGTPPRAGGERSFSPLLFKEAGANTTGSLWPLSRLAQEVEHELCVALGLDDGQEVAAAVEQDQARSRDRLRQGA
jgi:hypothetical protein